MNKIIEVIEHIEKTIGSSLILTGSHALKLYGILSKDFEGSGDIDLVCNNPSKEVLDRIDKFRCDWPNEEDRDYDNDETFRCSYDGIDVDIFTNTIQEPWMIDSETGLHLALPNFILEAKKEHGRKKDKRDIEDLIDHIRNITGVKA